MVVRVLDDYYLAITAILTIGYQLIFFTIAYTFQIDSVTDFGGGSNVALLAILTLVLGQTWYVRQIIATTFAVLWGARLG
ncbi:3127_t:CDS:2, partial [Funneliformis caledonium]